MDRTEGSRNSASQANEVTEALTTTQEHASDSQAGSITLNALPHTHGHDGDGNVSDDEFDTEVGGSGGDDARARSPRDDEEVPLSLTRGSRRRGGGGGGGGGGGAIGSSRGSSSSASPQRAPASPTLPSPVGGSAAPRPSSITPTPANGGGLMSRLSLLRPRLPTRGLRSLFPRSATPAATAAAGGAAATAAAGGAAAPAGRSSWAESFKSYFGFGAAAAADGAGGGGAGAAGAGAGGGGAGAAAPMSWRESVAAVFRSDASNTTPPSAAEVRASEIKKGLIRGYRIVPQHLKASAIYKFNKGKYNIGNYDANNPVHVRILKNSYKISVLGKLTRSTTSDSYDF